ncbi:MULTISPECIES: hypothetical protein [unclassified Streptomyces]|uniref:hypothetical protein n=1 Tax=unclassified Streptomyces TaxID=2593676 RepID=UPI003407EB4A
MPLTDLNNGFSDDEQRRRVQRVVHDRLADDRDPQECRFVMRFWWQLVVSYQEVSMDELSLNVGQPKLDAIEALISAIRSPHADIDAWITTTQRVFPVVQDRGFRAAQDNERLHVSAGANSLPVCGGARALADGGLHIPYECQATPAPEPTRVSLNDQSVLACGFVIYPVSWPADRCR